MACNLQRGHSRYSEYSAINWITQFGTFSSGLFVNISAPMYVVTILVITCCRKRQKKWTEKKVEKSEPGDFICYMIMSWSPDVIKSLVTYRNCVHFAVLDSDLPSFFCISWMQQSVWLQLMNSTGQKVLYTVIISATFEDISPIAVHYLHCYLFCLCCLVLSLSFQSFVSLFKWCITRVRSLWYWTGFTFITAH